MAHVNRTFSQSLPVLVLVAICVSLVLPFCSSSTGPEGFHVQHGLQLTLDADYLRAVSHGGETFYHNAHSVSLDKPIYSLTGEDALPPQAAAGDVHQADIDPDCLLGSVEELDSYDIEAAVDPSPSAFVETQHSQRERDSSVWACLCVACGCYLLVVL